MSNHLLKYYLGIDGGGTKTKFTVCRAEEPNASASPFGEIVGEYTSTCCHYLQIGFDGLEELIRDGVSCVCQIVRDNLEANASDFAPIDIDYAFLGLAGYADIVTDDPKIKAAVQAALKTFATEDKPDGIPFGIGNDCENALAGALAGKPGINVIAGTGSVGCGRDEYGGYFRCGGWHHALGGDEGSAYWIAWNLLHEFQRQSDGRDERTALYDAVTKALDLPSDDALVTRIVEEWDLDRTRIAALSPMVSELAAAGDPHALAILADAAVELADYAIAIKKQLNFSGDIPVSGTGGIFSIGPAVTDVFDQKLRENGMHYVEPLYSPDIGAVLLAIKGGVA